MQTPFPSTLSSLLLALQMDLHLEQFCWRLGANKTWKMLKRCMRSVLKDCSGHNTVHLAGQ